MENSFRHAQCCANVRIIFVKNVFCYLETKKKMCLFSVFILSLPSTGHPELGSNDRYQAKSEKVFHLPCVSFT